MKTVALLALLSVLFVPPRGHLRAEYFFVAILLLIVLNTRGRQAIRAVRTEVLCLAGLSVSILVSIIAYNLSTTTFHWRDLMSVVRYLALIAMLVATAGISFHQRDRKRLLLILCSLAAVGGLLSIVQFYDVGGVNELFLALYRGAAPLSDTYYNTFVLGGNSRRVIGTAGNPNLWAYILTMLSIFVVARIVIGQRYRWLPVLVLLIVANLMTGSRSSAFGFLVASLAVIAIGATKVETRTSAMAAAAGALLIVPIAFAIYTTVINVETQRYSFQNIESLYLRMQLWGDTLVEYSDHLVLGRGPAKTERREGTLDARSASYRDSIFISLYAEQGIVGLSIWLGLIVAIWRRLRSAVRVAASDPTSLQIAAAMMGVFVAFIVFNTASDALFSVQAATTFMFLYGISISATTQVTSERIAAPRTETDWTTL